MTQLVFGIALLCLAITGQAQTPADYQISGTVFDESNQPIEKVRVCAVPADYRQVPQVHCALSDRSGRFVIKADHPSLYRIQAEKSAAGYNSQQFPFYRNPAVTPLEVTLTENDRNASVSVFLGQRNGTLVGRMIDATTTFPVESARLLMCHANAPQICNQQSVKDPDGNFEIQTPHVPFTLTIIADGYEEWFGPNGSARSPISVPSGAKLQMPAALRRRADAARRALSEKEKQPGVNLPAPVLSSPADRTEFDFYPRPTKVEWQPVEGAAYYLVEIDYCDGRDRQLRECVNPNPLTTAGNKGLARVQATSFAFDFVGAQPGRWRVWAVDAQGRDGFKSPWRIFFYLK